MHSSGPDDGAARHYSWPPFEAGNVAAVKHGAASERHWSPIAELLEAAILPEAPWLTRPAFRLALQAWAAAEAKARLVDDWLDLNGLLDAEGVPRPANALADRLHTRAITLRGQLGLDPTSFGKLLAVFSATPAAGDVLEALRAEGAAILTARQPAALVAAPGEAERAKDGSVT